jgi:hypothetical protein
MTREGALHQAAVLLDEVGEAEIEKFFEQHVCDPIAEGLIRRRLVRWKQQQLARMESAMMRMQSDAASDLLH